MARVEQWRRIAQTEAFGELMRRKKSFLIPATIFFMAFYFGLPVLAAFTTVLNAPVVGNLTWAWLYALGQFAMTWGLMHLYLSRANAWDRIVERARQEAASAQQRESEKDGRE